MLRGHRHWCSEPGKGSDCTQHLSGDAAKLKSKNLTILLNLCELVSLTVRPWSEMHTRTWINTRGQSPRLAMLLQF